MNDAWTIEAMDTEGDIYTRTFVGDMADWSKSQIISHIESMGGIVISIERICN